MKKFLMIFCCALTVFTVKAQFSGAGSGTEEDPYQITNADELTEIANFLGNKYRNTYFKLMNDIDLTDWIATNNPSNGWNPIGDPSNPFRGKFDGAGYTIKGLYINRTDSEYVGFFGYTSSADIHDLKVTGTNVAGANYTGGLAGYIKESTTLTNCHITIEPTSCISGNGYVGGLIGWSLYSTVSKCSYNGNVQGTDNYIGGLAGWAEYSSIDSCLVEGNIQSPEKEDIGGIVGRVNSRLRMSNSHHKGSVSGKNQIGGIVGHMTSDYYYDHIISDCSHYGSVSGEENIGGLVGLIYQYSSSSAHTSTIMGSTCGGTIKGTKFIGGIIGKDKVETYQSCSANICDCSSNCTISGQTHIGGIAGLKHNGNLSRCYSQSKISGKEYIGGIVGFLSSGTLTSNVSICDSITINSTSNTYGRVCGAINSETMTDEGYYMMMVENYNYQDWMYETTDEEWNGIISTLENIEHIDDIAHMSVEELARTLTSVSVIQRVTGEKFGYFSEFQNKITKIDDMCTDTYDVFIIQYEPRVLFYFLINAELPNIMVYTMNFDDTGKPKFNMGGLDEIHSCDPDTTVIESNLLSNNVKSNHPNGLRNCRLYNLEIVSNKMAIKMPKPKANGGSTIGANGTMQGNLAYDNCVITVNGEDMYVTDDEKNGTGVSLEALKDENTYLGIGWDFILTWALNNNEGYPYLQWEKRISAITLSKTVANLVIGETITLEATITPLDADNQELDWSSSDETIATVVDGNVTAIDEGTVTITATAKDGSNTSASCSIIVSTAQGSGPSHFDIADGVALNITKTKTYDKVNYNRTFSTVGKWQALYIPFSIPVDTLSDNGLEVAELNNVHMYDTDEDGKFDKTTIEFLYLRNGATSPNYPYLIKASTTGEKTISIANTEVCPTVATQIECATTRQTFKIKGTYTGVSGAEMYNNNYYAMGGGSLVRVEDATSGLKPQRWYLSIENKDGSPVEYFAPSMRIMINGVEIEEEETTGIQSIVTSSDSETVYTLDGRKMNPNETLPAGIYVKNHQKMIVR